MTGPPEQGAEEEPDVRFTYANERTFLAWNRTALALIATGVAATQLLPKLQVEWGRRLLGLPLIALGALVAAKASGTGGPTNGPCEGGSPFPRSLMPVVLAVGSSWSPSSRWCSPPSGPAECHGPPIRGSGRGFGPRAHGPGVEPLGPRRRGRIAVLLRHVWPLSSTAQLVALGLISAAAVGWAVALYVFTTAGAGQERGSLWRSRGFGLMTAATVLLGVAAFILAFFPRTDGQVEPPD